MGYFKEQWREMHPWDDDDDYEEIYKREDASIIKELIKTVPGVNFSPFTDPRDGKVYKTVKIGDQVWMAENLNYDAGEGCCFYDNDPENGKKYGRLYAWEAMKRAVPEGWRLPTKEEYEILLKNLGGKGENAYNQIIPGGSSGFNALFGGYRLTNGNFYTMGADAYFWSSSEDDDNNAWGLNVISYLQKAGMYGSYKDTGFSVRCIKD